MNRLSFRITVLEKQLVRQSFSNETLRFMKLHTAQTVVEPDERLNNYCIRTRRFSVLPRSAGKNKREIKLSETSQIV